MTLPQPVKHMRRSVLQREASYKSDYYDGEIFAIAGVSVAARSYRHEHRSRAPTAAQRQAVRTPLNPTNA